MDAYEEKLINRNGVKLAIISKVREKKEVIIWFLEMWNQNKKQTNVHAISIKRNNKLYHKNSLYGLS